MSNTTYKKLLLATSLSAAFVAPVIMGASSPISNISYAATSADLESLNDQLKDIDYIAREVMKTDDFKNIPVKQRYWLSTPESHVGLILNSNDQYKKQELIDRLKAELNRQGARDIVDSLGLSLPAGFDNYHEEAYHKEIKDLYLLANEIQKHPDFNKLSKISQRWIKYFTNHAERSAVRLDDEETTYYHINNLKMALNRGGALEIINKVGSRITDDLKTYTETDTEKELRDLLEITSIIRDMADFKKVDYNSRTNLIQASSKAADQSFGAEESKAQKALADLKKELERPAFKDLYKKARDQFYNKNTATDDVVVVLKEALDANKRQVESAEYILNNFPNTIKGKEKELVGIMEKSYNLQVRAQKKIKELTGEDINIKPLNIPAKYKNL